MTDDIVIRAENLAKAFDKGRHHGKRLARLLYGTDAAEKTDVYSVFSDVSFTVRRGEVVGILGVNGAGKSTLLQVIAGVMMPTSGRVECHGRVSALLELGAGFNPEFTGRENVFLNASILGLSDREIEERLPSILAFADLEDEFIDMPVKTYSSGMYVRLAFAVAIHVSPDILIVDEALAVGDIFFQQKCFSYLTSSMRGVTKLFVTHDLATLATLAERVLVLDRHRLVFDGDPSEAIRVYQSMVHGKPLFEKTAKANGKGEATAAQTPVPAQRKYPFDPVPDERLTGLLDVLISDLVILVDDEKTDLVAPGQSVTIAMRFVNRRDVGGRFVIGFFFRDRTSQMVFGQNTLTDASRMIDILPGENVATVEFEWPNLKSGEYTLTVGIGEFDPSLPLGADGNPVQEIKCWANNVRAVMCRNRDNTGCLLAVENVRFAVNAVHESDHVSN
ncbi:MAG: ABC transporter ATP-binding protein [Hyphomicrobiales bacterium]|nr:ABC transporter ATP-binding protein [Hyphomicrobiales bacterium]